MATPQPRHVRAIAGRIAAFGVALALLVPTPAAAVSGANGVQLNVAPTSVTGSGEVLVTVTGSGFSTTQNSGFGIYVSFGERPVPGDTSAFTDANRHYNAGPGHGTIWVRPDTPSGPNQAKLNANGTFSIQLAVRSSFTAANGTTYPRSGGGPLGVFSYAAHGTEVSGFQQYAFVPMTFQAAATPAPATPPPATPPPATPRPATPAPVTPGTTARAATPPPAHSMSAGANASAEASATPTDASPTESTSPTGSAEPSTDASPTSSVAVGSSTPTPAPSATAEGGAGGPRLEPGQVVLAGGVGVAVVAAAALMASRRRERPDGSIEE